MFCCSQATGSHDAMTGGSNTTLQEPDHDTQMGLAPTTKLTVPEKPWSDSKYIFVSPDRSTRRFTFVAPNSSNTNPFVRYSTGSLPPQKLGSMEISRHIFVWVLKPVKERSPSLCPDPPNTWRNKNVVITSKRSPFDVIAPKWHRFGVTTTLLWRNVSAGGQNTEHWRIQYTIQ